MHHKYAHVIGCAGIILPCLGIEMFDFFPLQKRSARGKVKQLVSLMLSNQTPSNLSCCPHQIRSKHWMHWKSKPIRCCPADDCASTRYSNPCAPNQTPTSAAPNSSQRNAEIGRNRAWKFETQSPKMREQLWTIFPVK